MSGSESRQMILQRPSAALRPEAALSGRLDRMIVELLAIRRRPPRAGT
jgi:hypothetical protein